MNATIRTHLLEIDRLMDEVLAECATILSESDSLKPADIADTDDAALIEEAITSAQETLSEIPLQYK